MPELSFDLTKHLAGQPLQMMMRRRQDGEYLYCFHLWHERLLQHYQQEQQQQRDDTTG